MWKPSEVADGDGSKGVKVHDKFSNAFCVGPNLNLR